MYISLSASGERQIQRRTGLRVAEMDPGDHERGHRHGRGHGQLLRGAQRRNVTVSVNT